MMPFCERQSGLTRRLRTGIPTRPPEVPKQGEVLVDASDQASPWQAVRGYFELLAAAGLFAGDWRHSVVSNDSHRVLCEQLKNMRAAADAKAKPTETRRPVARIS